MRIGAYAVPVWFVLAFLACPAGQLAAGEKQDPKKEDDTDPDEAKAVRRPQPKPDVPDPNDPAKKNGNPVAPAVKEACAKCSGRGLIPCATHSKQILILRVSDKPPDCCGGAGFTVCPDCKGAQERYDKIAEAVTKRQSHLDGVQKRLNQQFAFFQTPHACYFSQVAEDQAVQAVTACETLAQRLGVAFKGGALDSAWPPDCRIFLLSSQRNYEAFHEALGAGKGGGEKDGEGQKDLYKKTAASFNVNTGAINAERFKDQILQQRAVNIFAHVLMRNATANKAPPWMDEGFAAWCEFSMFQSCKFYTIAYEQNKELEKVDMRASWSESIRKGLAARTTISIPDLMEVELRGLKPLVYQQCWSFTTYLIARGAKSFEKVIAEVKGGAGHISVVEKAYGQKTRDMTNSWARWAGQQP